MSIDYAKNMSICVAKSEGGNFLTCRIKLILINRENTNIFFLGQTNEIIPYCEMGGSELLQLTKKLQKKWLFFHIPPFCLLIPFPKSLSDLHQFICPNSRLMIQTCDKYQECK